MLKKLLKHEFRATGRVMLPLLIAELLVSLLAGLSARGLNGMSRADSSVRDPLMLRILYMTTLAAFVFGMFALFVIAMVLMIQRFYKSLLRDEGYLSMTLPVSVDEHIWAKLVVSFVWFDAVALLCFLAMFVVMSIGDDALSTFFNGFPINWKNVAEPLREIGGGNIVLYLAEMLLLAFFGIGSMCLRCYAAMAIGCSASDHKLLLSFVSYIVIGFVLSILSNTLAFGLLPHMDISVLYGNIGGTAATHVYMGLSLLGTAALFALFYFVTRWFLKNKLNLA